MAREARSCRAVGRSEPRCVKFVQQEFIGERREDATWRIERRLDLFQPGQQSPVLLGLFGFLDPPFDFLCQEFIHVFDEVFLLEDTVTLGVNALALCVEHIVIFQGVFADIEVGPFHSVLRLLDHIADQAGLEGDSHRRC